MKKFMLVSEVPESYAFISNDLEVEYMKELITGSVKTFNAKHDNYDSFFLGQEGDLWGMHGIVPRLQKNLCFVGKIE